MYCILSFFIFAFWTLVVYICRHSNVLSYVHICRLNAKGFVMETKKITSSGKFTVGTLSQTLQMKGNAVFDIIAGGILKMFQTIDFGRLSFVWYRLMKTVALFHTLGRRSQHRLVTRPEILKASLLTGKLRKHNLPAHALSRKDLYSSSLRNIYLSIGIVHQQEARP